MRYVWRIILFIILTCCSSATFAAKWWPSAVVVFGDEKSDNGNTFNQYLFPVSPPYWNGRFSNGPVWSEYLASEFKLIARPETNPTYDKKSLFLNFATAYAVVNPSNATGMFYAYGGPQANGITNFKVSTLSQQIDAYLKVNRAYKRNTIAVMWIGMHDLESSTCLKNTSGCMNTVIEMIEQSIERLYSEELRYFVILTIPDVSRAPAIQNYFSTQDITTFKNIVRTYNGQYYAMQAELQQKYPKMKIIIFNISDFNNPLYTQLADPSGRICYTGTYYYNNTQNPPCKDVANYYWWDGYDPTTKADENLAKAVYEAIANNKAWNLYNPWWKRF
jgi:phospholipase/lecithinase/hemolysin